MSAKLERLDGGFDAAGILPGKRQRLVDAAGESSVDADWSVDADRQAFRVLTAADAEQLRRVEPSVSPWRVVRMQAVAGAACAALVWAFTSREAAVWSSLYGAAATVLPSALLARGMTRGAGLRRATNAVASAAGFMFWEMLKIGVAVTMLVIAVRVVPQLSWPALLVTMAVCIKVNWFALLWRGPRPNNKA